MIGLLLSIACLLAGHVLWQVFTAEPMEAGAPPPLSPGTPEGETEHLDLG
jgi:hypothetical protein